MRPSRGGSASSPRYYTAADYHEMYKAGKVTPLQVAQTLLSTIKKGQSTPSKYEDAWLEFPGKEQMVLEAAKASTERYAAGKFLGILDGVPIGVKDDIDVKGYPNQVGMQRKPGIPCFEDKKETSWPVLKLQEAGAVVIGRNKMHECGSETSGLNVREEQPSVFSSESEHF